MGVATAVVKNILHQSLSQHCSMLVLQRAVRKVMNRDLSDAPLHIVYSLFDKNKDNNLASSELLTVSLLHRWTGLLAFLPMVCSVCICTKKGR